MRFRTLLFILTFSVFIFPDLVLGEYRAYELKITNTDTSQSRTVVSTIDNLQYSTYYPLQKSEIIEYVDSWMCYGNTGDFQSICPKPDRSTASLLTVPKAGNRP